MLLVGEFPWIKCAAYVPAQLLGVCFGALLGGAIDTNADIHIGNWEWSDKNNGPGCVPQAPNMIAVFVWEYFGTLMLVLVVLSVAVAKPGFGHVAPLAIGKSSLTATSIPIVHIFTAILMG